MEYSQEPNKPNIFEYTDYRVFLKDFYQHMKRGSSYFSFRYFSRVAGFQAPNVLKLVIEGQRNLSEPSIKKFCKGLRLTQRESSFFAHLVKFSQSKTLDEKTKWSKLLTESKSLEKINPVRLAELRYFSRWYYVAIRELAASPNFQDNPKWIAHTLQPKISLEEAELALRELLTLGLLVRTESGKVIQRENSLNTDNEMPYPLIAQYHTEVIRLGAESIQRFNSKEREISAITIPLSQESFEKIKNKLRDLREEFLTLAENDAQAEKVYQINFQMFPISESLGSPRL